MYLVREKGRNRVVVSWKKKKKWGNSLIPAKRENTSSLKQLFALLHLKKHNRCKKGWLLLSLWCQREASCSAANQTQSTEHQHTRRRIVVIGSHCSGAASGSAACNTPARSCVGRVWVTRIALMALFCCFFYTEVQGSPPVKSLGEWRKNEKILV